jgi:hypothetical protein
MCWLNCPNVFDEITSYRPGSLRCPLFNIPHRTDQLSYMLDLSTHDLHNWLYVPLFWYSELSQDGSGNDINPLKSYEPLYNLMVDAFYVDATNDRTRDNQSRASWTYGTSENDGPCHVIVLSQRTGTEDRRPTIKGMWYYFAVGLESRMDEKPDNRL